MKTTALFISEDTLKAKGYIGDNVDMKVIMPTVFMVQDTYLHDILGSALLQEINDKVIAATITASSAYTTLMDNYIQPCILWYIQAELQVFNTFRMANKGLLTKSSDNAQPASMSDLIAVGERLKNVAEYYAQRLTDYLRANQTVFEKYLNQTGAGEDARYPNGTSYQSGIYLGGSGHWDCDNPYWHERH